LTARAILDRPEPSHDHDSADASEGLRAIDPAFALDRLRRGDEDVPEATVARHAFWKPAPSVEASEALDRLWRHGLATGASARRLALEADDRDPCEVFRAAFLHRLGLWILAAVDAELLAKYLRVPDHAGRLALEREWFGEPIETHAHTQARRFGCRTLLVDAVRLAPEGASRGIELADEPDRIRIIREAASRAQRTPWRLDPATGPDSSGDHPRIRMLVAEVQSRAPGPFLERESFAQEERWARALASERLERRRIQQELGLRNAFLESVTSLPAHASLDECANRAARFFCEIPSVATARACGPRDSVRGGSESSESEPLGTKRVVDLWEGRSGRVAVELALLGDSGAPEIESARTWWRAWLVPVAERLRLEARVETALQELEKSESERQDGAERARTLESVAEFAAGAGHELNNPLAVIQGRAQILRGRTKDPEARKALDTIVAQAQRAHRMLRDLMYVARPPLPREQACRPDSLLESVLEDLRPEAERRGVRLVPRVLKLREPMTSDPDALLHLAEVLIRNALEATPAGGFVEVIAHSRPDAVRWSVRDSGSGVAAEVASRLFDPFYCGRTAGRGLGLGLPRVARFLERAGGSIECLSGASSGTTFRVHLPISPSSAPTVMRPSA
jgi:signal transduction histidine kinase